MNGDYIGHLSRKDPLYPFLRHDILGRLGVCESDPEFRVFRPRASNEVYLYEEAHTRTRLICKFFGHTYGWDRERGAGRAAREAWNLETLRGYGLVGCPHHVIRPLGVNHDLNCALVLEYYAGESFSHAIKAALNEGQDAHLFWRLKALGYFLATLHNRTANGAGVNFEPDCRYLDHLVSQLQWRQAMESDGAQEFRWLRDRWREKPEMWQDQQVWLHGDATPANFLFGSGLDVAAIDLERMKRGDRVFDVGRVAGELQSAFMAVDGHRGRAEPFIGHFLWEYACHFPDRDRAFRSLSARLPYYMALTLLRIARNDWVSSAHRFALLEQAREHLRSF